MNLINRHNQLKNLFNIDKIKVLLPEKINCHSFAFHSEFYFSPGQPTKINHPLAHLITNETGENQNRQFRYAIFAPKKKERFNKCIILLHGLNERQWDKYLTWAHYLVLKTGKPVLLFPLAFHINRSPKAWCSPRLMMQLATFRQQTHPSIQMSSFANAALSLRMETTPEMFPISGIQSYFDIVKLALDIKSGKTPLFSEGCDIDFFAYSIGALLAEVLLLSDPLGMFSNNKAYLFCGGATFDKTNGVSKSIMDNIAFEKLMQFMDSHQQITNRITLPHYQAPLLPDAWKYFQSMSKKNAFTHFREAAFDGLCGRIMATGLVNDQVVPAKAIEETLKGYNNNRPIDVNTLNFPYPYSHEKPFPLDNYKMRESIEESFNKVFNHASWFLS